MLCSSKFTLRTAAAPIYNSSQVITECIRPLNENTSERGVGWGWVKININGCAPNWLVCLIKDTITWLCCNYPFFLTLKYTLGLAWLCTHTHQHHPSRICAHTKTHTSGSGCNWQKCRLKTINNHNHHYRRVISISVCVCECVYDCKLDLVLCPLRSRPMDRCVMRKMASAKTQSFFTSLFYWHHPSPCLSIRLIIWKGIQWTTLIITGVHGWGGHKQLPWNEGREEKSRRKRKGIKDRG